MFSLFIDVSPSVTWISYVPSAEISLRIFSSPARMFWAYELVSVPIVIWIVFVYRVFPVFRIISSSPSIRNSTSGFSPIVNVRSTWVSWYVAVIVQIPLVNSFSILTDVSSFEFAVPSIVVFCRASVIVYVTCWDVWVPSSSRIILNVASSPAL